MIMAFFITDFFTTENLYFQIMKKHAKRVRRIRTRILPSQFGAAALDLCQVAAGRAEVFFECRLSPWDFAAGSLLVQEAGGCVTTLEGTTIDPLRPGSVFAANALCGGLTAELPRG